MPMTLNVGWQRKVGQPDYGSLCASCSVAVELNGAMVFEDLEGFHQRVRQAFIACQQAVNDQLTSQQQGKPSASMPRSGRAATETQGDSPQNGNGSNGNGATNGHRASQKQVDYINKLARQIRGLGVRRLEDLTNRMFSKPVADLTSFDASSLIDTLKAVKAGEVDLDTALNGAAT